MLLIWFDLAVDSPLSWYSLEISNWIMWKLYYFIGPIKKSYSIIRSDILNIYNQSFLEVLIFWSTILLITISKVEKDLFWFHMKILILLKMYNNQFLVLYCTLTILPHNHINVKAYCMYKMSVCFKHIF